VGQNSSPYFATPTPTSTGPLPCKARVHLTALRCHTGPRHQYRYAVRNKAARIRHLHPQGPAKTRSSREPRLEHSPARGPGGIGSFHFVPFRCASYAILSFRTPENAAGPRTRSTSLTPTLGPAREAFFAWRLQLSCVHHRVLYRLLTGSLGERYHRVHNGHGFRSDSLWRG
jgi:hypothetical protein